MNSKKVSASVVLVLLSASVAFAASHKWSAGWDVFGEPLNYKTSTVAWSLNATTGKLTVTYKLVGANPSKLYQVGVHVYCPGGTAPSMFGQFPVPTGCGSITRQGVTANVYEAELGVVTTDATGNGVFTVGVAGIAPGTYSLAFTVRDGAGCNLTGGRTDVNACFIDFQSPGPKFGNAITVTIP
jgi:hypothetical protein